MRVGRLAYRIDGGLCSDNGKIAMNFHDLRCSSSGSSAHDWGFHDLRCSSSGSSVRGWGFHDLRCSSSGHGNKGQQRPGDPGLHITVFHENLSPPVIGRLTLPLSAVRSPTKNYSHFRLSVSMRDGVRGVATPGGHSPNASSIQTYPMASNVPAGIFWQRA